MVCHRWFRCTLFIAFTSIWPCQGRPQGYSVLDILPPYELEAFNQLKHRIVRGTWDISTINTRRGIDPMQIEQTAYR